MKISAAGRALIAQREGCRLAAYRDSVGCLTIGVGHTGRMAPPAVTEGMRITPAQSDAFLAADLAPVEAAIAACVRVPIVQAEADALASLAFNIGVGGLERSSVVRRLNAGDRLGAADAFLLWDKPAALHGRRIAERRQFLGLDTPIARSASGRPSAPASAFPETAEDAAPMTRPQTTAPHPSGILGDLAGLLEMVAGNIGGIAKVGAVAPSIVGGAFAAIGDGEKAAADIVTLVADIRGGAWSEAPDAVFAILHDFVAILGKFGVSLPGLSEAVGKLPDTPAVATLKLAKAA